MGLRKTFDSANFEANDPRGRAAVKRYLEKEGWTVTEDPFGKYDIDLKAIRKDITPFFDSSCEMYIEVEVRQWRGICPFDCIHLPERKKKFLSPGRNVFFVALDQTLSYAIFIPQKFLIDENLKEVPNKYLKAKEYFYLISRQDCFSIQL